MPSLQLDVVLVRSRLDGVGEARLVGTAVLGGDGDNRNRLAALLFREAAGNTTRRRDDDLDGPGGHLSPARDGPEDEPQVDRVPTFDYSGRADLISPRNR